MSWLGAALAAVTALSRLALAWLAGRPAAEAEQRAARLEAQRDEASRPPAPPRDLVQRMRDGRL